MSTNLAKKVNLLHIIGSVYFYGGLERKVIQLLNNLDRDRFNIYLASLTPYEKEENGFLQKDIKVFSLNKIPGIDFKIIFKLSQILKQYKIDIIHSHNWATLFYAALAAKLAGTKVIIHGEHGIETKQIDDNVKQYLMKKILYFLCDHLVGISKDIKETLIHKYKVSTKKISVVYNGVEAKSDDQVFSVQASRRKYKLDKYKYVIGTVGRIKPVKDFITLIEALQIVKVHHQDIALVIAGPGNDKQNSYFSEIQQFLKVNKINDVIFTGAVEHVPELLRSFDVFVNSSLSEGISNTILEAMANKIPVIASNVGGNPELITHEISGLLFDVQNARICADCILTILNDTELKDNYVKAAYAHVVKHHTMSSMYQSNTDIYNRLFSGKAIH